MTSADSISLILRRLDEIERKLDRIMEELILLRQSAIRYAGAIVQGGPKPPVWTNDQNKQLWKMVC